MGGHARQFSRASPPADQGQTMRIELKNGQWIELKDSRTQGDSEDVLEYAVKGITQDGKYDINAAKHSTGTIASRLIACNLTSDDGQPVKFRSSMSFKQRTDLLRKIDVDIIDTITTAISKSDAARAEAVAEKNDETLTGEPA